ncbi:MAG: DUF935 family protein [Microscillaceae bacterium]|nr:DUF935 family protein [Microscillaceae bacterium]MDW8461040.1 DUF935 family protein [Cytophagales bacterium]
MKLFEKLQKLFYKKPSADVLLAEALAKISAKETISKKQNFYKARVFAADKHIKDWKNAIDEAISPPYYRKSSLAAIIEQIRYDAQVQAQIQTRKNGTLAERFILDASPEVQKLVKQIISVILDSLFFWASACEIEGTTLHTIPPEYLCVEQKELAFANEKGIPFEHFENLLVFENPYKHLGLLAFAAQYAIYKRFSLSDWSRHSELFGMPFLALRTPVTDETEIKKRHQALANFGSNAYVILDTDEVLEAIDTKSNTNPYEMYLQMIKFCDEQISKIIVGQVATADQKSFVGSAEVQERILDWYIEHDMLYVEEAMNTQVLPLLAKNGLISKNAVFEWEYFAKKQEAKDKRQENLQLHYCRHEQETYESYLLSLKKKVLTFPNEQVFDFDFEDFWKKQDDSLFNYYLNEFQKPIKDLFNEGEYAELQAKFTQNAYEFALAKASTFFEKSKDLSRQEAKSLFEKMERHTDTEKVQFALAIQAAQEWQEILKDEDIFPNLEYRAVMDENTRESHARLNGIIRPVRDDFWNKYFPPIDYRCRCTIRQHGKNVKITQNPPENLPAIPKGLRHNPGNSGKAFDFEHPYFENTTPKVLKNVAEYASYEKKFVKEYFDIKTGGFVVRDKKHKEDNWQKNVEASLIITKKEGYKIELLEKKAPDKISPDANINDIQADYKHPKNAKKLTNFVRSAIKKAKKQGNIAVLYLPKDYDFQSLYEGFEEYVKYIKQDNAEIELIIVATQDGKVVLLKKQDFEPQNAYWIEKIKTLKK